MLLSRASLILLYGDHLSINCKVEHPTVFCFRSHVKTNFLKYTNKNNIVDYVLLPFLDLPSYRIYTYLLFLQRTMKNKTMNKKSAKSENLINIFNE